MPLLKGTLTASSARHAYFAQLLGPAALSALAPNRLPRLKQLNRIKRVQQSLLLMKSLLMLVFCCFSCFAVKYLEFVFFCLFKGILANCWVTQSLHSDFVHIYISSFLPTLLVQAEKQQQKTPFYCHLLAVSNEMSGFPRRQTDTTTSLLLLLTAANQCWCRCYYFQDFSKRINPLSRQWVRKPDTAWKLYNCKTAVKSKLPVKVHTLNSPSTLLNSLTTHLK